eukprot:TRINITY_DN17645_c0_g1_i1.p1 TRINITY_DN17645_c0_g1~~TRINITY_DN17645_c0_g1_i1.p1  ORF type:complete len:138 (-),score=38.35 TRINITY_DN17645_c0_g1_i1:282-695(-)
MAVGVALCRRSDTLYKRGTENEDLLDITLADQAIKAISKMNKRLTWGDTETLSYDSEEVVEDPEVYKEDSLSSMSAEDDDEEEEVDEPVLKAAISGGHRSPLVCCVVRLDPEQASLASSLPSPMKSKLWKRRVGRPQ